MAIVDRKTAKDFAARCMKAKSLRGVYRVASRFRDTLPKDTKQGTWYSTVTRFMAFLRTGKVAFRIFMPGNVKLSFFEFSTLPLFTCPGAGDCLKWCYSFRSWQYPTAFFRQLQNSLLIKFNKDTISEAFAEMPDTTLRLYVNGDFDSVETVKFWMDALKARPGVSAYGYSKSWAELLSYNVTDSWPANYVLNISSGSKWADNEAYKAAMFALPITREAFEGVVIDTTGIEKGFARYDNPEYHNRVREAYFAKTGRKGFSCPGFCDDCGHGKHICGNGNANVPVLIGIH